MGTKYTRAHNSEKKSYHYLEVCVDASEYTRVCVRTFQIWNRDKLPKQERIV